jgi:transcriptional regulator with XRE-family HTH domain
MAHSQFLREKARSLRAQQRLTVDQLAERLELPRSTIYYWVRDLPPLSSYESGAASSESARRMGGHATRGTERRQRQAAYEEGLSSYDDLVLQPTFRDFVCVCVATGFERQRGTVALANSDPAVMRLATRWLRRLGDEPPSFSIRYRAGRSAKELRRFWSETVGGEVGVIRAQRTSEGGRLAGRDPCARHGVLTVTVHDALLGSRLDAWMGRMRGSWL